METEPCSADWETGGGLDPPYWALWDSRAVLAGVPTSLVNCEFVQGNDFHPPGQACDLLINVMYVSNPNLPGDGGSSIDQFKKSFYDKSQKILNDCIKSVFGSVDGPKVVPQTIDNSPQINPTKTGQELAKMANRPPSRGPLQGWNSPTTGNYGLVYIASQTWQNAGTNHLGAAGTYAHELGNILDEKLYPDTADPRYGMHHGNPVNKDKDTGQALQDCIFGVKPQ